MIDHAERLTDVDTNLSAIVEEAGKNCDFVVTCGHRGEAEQNDCLKRGTTKLPWPKSKHNALPSKAVDLVPLPVDWATPGKFYIIAGHMLIAAQKLGVKLTWGGMFRSFPDLPHFEVE